MAPSVNRTAAAYAPRRALEQNHVMPKPKTDAPADPDKLVREAAGSYRTSDDRFEVRGPDGGWFLVDTAQANEFGQELMHGPFGTLKALRAAIPGAREEKAKPMLAKPRPASSKGKKTQVRPPPSWIDQLPKPEGARVRLLIRALEGEGVADAEAMVRRDREGLFPTVAATLIQRRLDGLVDALPEKERSRARRLVARAAQILSGEGAGAAEPMPGWTLVELGPEPEPPNRRIVLGE
jgi:hypothetical protein